MVEVPGYRIEAELGSGGMGAVYRGVSLETGNPVAIKLVTAHARDLDAAERFRREAQVLTDLAHPGILAARECGVADGVPFLVTDLIRGESLDRVVARAGPLPEVEVRHLGERLAQALGHAHQRGVLHRDLKPSNVMLSAVGEPILIDFGLAKRLHTGDKLTQSGTVLGTPVFMAPEQATGSGDVGPAADLYGLGATLFFLLTGVAPFEHEGGLVAVLNRVFNDPHRDLRARRPDVSPELERVVNRCLNKAPRQRYASAFQLAQALTALPPLRTPRQPRGAAWRSAALGGLVLVAATVSAMLLFTPGTDEPAWTADTKGDRLYGVAALFDPPPALDHEQLRASLSPPSSATSPHNALEQGVRLVLLGELDDAVSKFEAGLSSTRLTLKLRGELHVGCARALELRGDLVPALIAYDDALTNATHAEWLRTRQECWARLLASWEEPPPAQTEREAKGHAELAAELRRRKRYTEAIAAYGRAIELEPSSVYSLVNRAQLHKREKRYQQALADFDRAIELRPRAARFWEQRGDVRRDMGLLQGALDDYSAALIRGPRSPTEAKQREHRARLLYRRARVEERLGLEQACVEDLRRALDLGLPKGHVKPAQDLLRKLAHF